MVYLSKVALILIGPPGIGKGTFAVALSKYLGFPHISSSKLLTNMKNVSAEIANIINSGALVSDEIVNKVFEAAFVDDTFSDGVILDGYPRTINQALYIFDKFEKTICVRLILDENILIKRLSGRLTCPQCKKSYNSCHILDDKYNMQRLMPNEDDLKECDGCNHLVSRPDDSPAIVKKRVDLYFEKTFPLINFYSEKGLISNFEIFNGVGDVSRLIEHINTIM